MSKIYIEFNFTVEPLRPGTEILIAELGLAGFEGFVETDEGVRAYIQKKEWNEKILEHIHILSSSDFSIEYTRQEIEPVNWNASWEKNFDPIEVNDVCVIRAPFHAPYNVRFEIIIEPKMSFGTGHHETTFMMLQYLLENDLDGKAVLDMGCGTAVLAILAEMKGASNIDAIDNDEWCVENSKENIARNNCQRTRAQLGDASILPSKETYKIIIANINRNILLNDLPTYISALKKGGDLYLSGFYKKDLTAITSACNILGLTFVSSKLKNEWIAAKFVN
jgi:ribosomal protein L11 methyltransferase